ncbi:MAG: Fumarate reductase flavoprotein subunit precursor [Syntrophaceae bacterium PtaB.Bin095]|nr:MAG: Fumarate reductase flavoprotein subunit precursor [Syntrophaceae bacterium PtaB.Bin095]
MKRRIIRRPVFSIIFSACMFALLATGCTRPPTPPAVQVPPAKEAIVMDKAGLAGIHQGKAVDCAACHGKSLEVDDNETIVNAKCRGCHGSLSDVAKKSKGHINPHKSHLGEIGCTACHHGHTASRSYCLGCHAFNMPIPGSGVSASEKKGPVKMDESADSTDIVVVGAGAAGYTAAISAHDAGAKVILLEKQPITGGNSMISAGGMNAAGTRMQQARGLKDSSDVMFKDTMTGSKNIANPELVKVLAEKSSASVDWLTAIGADMSDVGRLAGASSSRAHRPSGGAAVGSHLNLVLRKNATDRKIDVRVNSKVLQVLRDREGRVTGVQVEGKHRGLYVIHAKAVIVAAGGFGANAAMVESYRPEYKGMTTSNQPGATGEGMKFGEAAGAQLIDMKEIQIHPTVAAGSRILITEGVRGNGAILVNQEGKRFVNELTTRDAASAAILKQRDGMAYLIIDEGIRKSLRQIEGYFHLDLVKEGATLKELAGKIGVPDGALEETVAKYNAAFDAKNDSEFKRPDLPRPIRNPKFYAIGVQPGIHYTMGGLKIDTETRVIGKDGKPIPGLFAAGEVTGGVHGANRLGGNSISETITFGLIAGNSAAKVTMEK